MASGKKSIMLMLKILDLESINAASFKLTDTITTVPATPKLKFTQDDDVGNGHALPPPPFGFVPAHCEITNAFAG